jgi:CheY-like chemotaxis protein
MQGPKSVAIAHEGEGELALIREHWFQLVRLEVMMPGLNGREVLKIVRETPAAADLPVITATGLGGRRRHWEATGSGANGLRDQAVGCPAVLARIERRLPLKRAPEKVKLLDRNFAKPISDLK